MALENWLNRNVETEQYRSRVRCVALGLGDLKACSEEMLYVFAVGDEVEALWDEKWWKAVVHDLRDDGSYEVHWDGMEVYDFVAANAVRAVPDAVRAVPWGAWGGLGRIFGK